MISAYLKKTFPLDLEQPLSQFIKSQYGKTKVEELSVKLKEINQLRKDCMVEDKTANPTVDIPKHIQYYNTLCILEKRFPFGKASSGWFSKVQTVMVEFRWCDAYIPKRISSNYSIKLEKLSVLYNLAALMSLQAVKRQGCGEEGLKEALSMFRDAAGAFKYLSAQDESVGLACTLDIQRDSANMLALLMLAQAQACFFEMATKKKTSPGLLAKLAMGTANLFEKIHQMVLVNEGLKNWLSKSVYSYEDHIHFQVKCYKAAAEYWQSQVDLKSAKEGCYGLEIARLNIAFKYLEGAAQLSKKVVPALEESRKNLADRYVFPRLTQAAKDNQLIYFEVVPSPSELTPVEGAQNVKENPFSLSNSVEDPFKSLVSKAVLKKAEEIRANLRAEAKRLSDAVNEQTDSARAVLASLGLPASLESIQVEEGLPDSVWNRIAEIQKSGGVQELESALQRIESVNAEAWKIQQEIEKALDAEERIFNEVKAKIGPKWQVKPSSQLNGKYRSDLKTIVGLLNQAVQSNAKLQKQIRDETKLFKDLEKSRTQLGNDLPKSDDKQNENKQTEKLKQLLDKLSNCIAQRDELKQEYNKQADIMDITSLLVAKETEMTDEKTGNEEDFDLKAATTKALEEIETKIKETNAAQEKLLDEITQTNQEFVKLKGSDPTQMRRETFIHSLNQACEKFNKCQQHLKDGLKFYSDLITDYITPLQSNVDSFVLARENERDMHLADLNTNVAKLGINAYGNLTDTLPEKTQMSNNSNSSNTSSSQNSYNPMQQPWGAHQQWPYPYYQGQQPQHPMYGATTHQNQPQPPYGVYPPYYGQQPSNPFYNTKDANNNNSTQ